MLPKERAAIEVQARALDDVIAVRPLGQALDAESEYFSLWRNVN